MGYLKDNKHRFLSEFDMALVSETPQLEIFIDSFFEMFDRVLEKGPDQFFKIVSIQDIPENLINHLSSAVGWRQTDYKFNFLTFRDLVQNIVRIYKIKGTNLSYDVFFRTFGYRPTVHELWYDKNGALVRNKPFGAPDPSQNNKTLNKSNFLEIELDLEVNDPDIPDPFSDPDFLRIIFEYLTFLKPIHIRYKPILLNIPPVFENPVVVDTSLPVIIIGDKNSPSGIGVDGLFEDRPDGELVDEFQLFAAENQVDCPPLLYNNSIRYGDSIARVVEFDGKQFPVSIIQRQQVRYGEACSPVQDELKIVIETEKNLGEDTMELFYNNYAHFDNQYGYDSVDRKIEIDDSTEIGSQEFGFGPGNVWTKPTP